jgi:predicted phosphodiesterase
MKYVIMGDIHSNLEALKAVLAYCKTQKLDNYICIGDIVGYNANPVECLDLIQNLNLHMAVRGNHDEYAGLDSELAGFNPFAKTAILWTRERLNLRQKRWLVQKKLKEIDPKNSITVVHATLDSPASWGYIFDNYHAIDNFSYQYTKLCFCGHSHVPVFFKKCSNIKSDKLVVSLPEWEKMNGKEVQEIVVDLDNDSKYLVNVGSVGQPRNGDPRASFVVFDAYRKTVKRVSLQYDVKKAQEKIINAGLPTVLAERLSAGC